MGDNLVPNGLSGLQRLAKGHPWPGHYGSARALAVNPRAPKARALVGFGGIDRSARPSKWRVMPRMQRSALSGTPVQTACICDMSDNPRAERVIERLQRSLLQVDIAEIIIHEGDEPNAVVNFLDAERLTRKNR